MTGRQTHLAELADCERALGRPERAIDLYRGADLEKMDKAGAIELLIVAAGARSDLGQHDAAVAMLQIRELTADEDAEWAARLRYAYADALLAAGRREEAREWFARAAASDQDQLTNAAERLLELDGVTLEGDEESDADSDEEGRADSDGDRAEAAREVLDDELEDGDVEDEFDDDEDDAPAAVAQDELDDEDDELPAVTRDELDDDEEDEERAAVAHDEFEDDDDEDDDAYDTLQDDADDEDDDEAGDVAAKADDAAAHKDDADDEPKRPLG